MVPFTKLPVEYTHTPRSDQRSFYHVALLLMVFVIIIFSQLACTIFDTSFCNPAVCTVAAVFMSPSLSDAVSRNRVICHYNLWQLLRQILGPRLSLKLADYVRTVSASLAPCNPFQDSVS